MLMLSVRKQEGVRMIRVNRINQLKGELFKKERQNEQAASRLQSSSPFFVYVRLMYIPLNY